jgi:hypothetical protein
LLSPSKPPKAIRSGSGLGDAIYLQSAARHLAERGQPLEVCSDWPDVFRPLGDLVTVGPYRRERIDIKAHYVMRKGNPRTDQFQDVCIAAGIREPVEFKLGWQPLNRELVARVRWGGKPVVVVQLPRKPFDRRDGFGATLLPDCNIIQQAIDRIRPRAKVVLIGKGDALYRFSGIDLDLSNRTSVTDLLDVATVADGFLGYVSFLVPLAESQSKPALIVWSRRGLTDKHEFVRQITPEKIFHRASSHAIFDDCSDGDIAFAVGAFCDQIGCGAAIPQQARGDRRVRAGRP